MRAAACGDNAGCTSRLTDERVADGGEFGLRVGELIEACACVRRYQ